MLEVLKRVVAFYECYHFSIVDDFDSFYVKYYLFPTLSKLLCYNIDILILKPQGGPHMRNIFGTVDNTFNEIREKSLFQWLEEMEAHEDIAVRGGVKLTREYIQHLKEEIRRLESENDLKAQYLKKLKEKKK